MPTLVGVPFWSLSVLFKGSGQPVRDTHTALPVVALLTVFPLLLPFAAVVIADDVPSAVLLERCQFSCPTKVIGAIPSCRPDRGPILYSKEEVICRV